MVNLFVMGTFLFSTHYGAGERAVVGEYKKVESNPQIITVGEKATELQIHTHRVWFVNVTAPLCSTIVAWSTGPFDEMTITWNNRPPKVDSLAIYKDVTYPAWYTFSSTALANYVQSHIGDTIAFCLEIHDRNGGACDVVWYHSTRQSSNIPKLIHNSNTYYSIGDAWVTDGQPLGPNGNSGADTAMLVCSCTLTIFSGTQLAYVEFYIPPTSIEEESERSNFIFEVHPNPFFSYARISYAVPYNEERVTLRVYNMMGELVKTLVNEIQPIGRHEVIWDGKNEKGKELLSGYYFYKLMVGEESFTTKSLLLRL